MHQMITFRLADSLPADVLCELSVHPRDDGPDLDDLLNAGHGSCLLANPGPRDCVRDALRFHHGLRYNLAAYAIMPNHVHALIAVLPDQSLTTIVRSWKSFSARQINRATGRLGRLWQADYHDRYIRDEEHFDRACSYIWGNPARAGGQGITNLDESDGRPSTLVIRAPGSRRHLATPSVRSAMTLVEILIAIAIFMALSTAMVAIFTGASDLYEKGEASRAGGDIAMSVLSLLDKDIAQAVAPDQGGHCFAEVTNDNGDCAIGWTILRHADVDDADRDQNRIVNAAGRFGFVLWSVDTTSQLRRLEIDTAELRDVERIRFGNLYAPTPLYLHGRIGQGSVINTDCLHFGAWLVGTSHRPYDDPKIRSRLSLSKDGRSTRWAAMRDLLHPDTPLTTQPDPTLPQATPWYSTTQKHDDNLTPLHYPSGLRITLILGTDRERGRLLDDVAVDATTLRIGGLKSVPLARGSVLCLEHQQDGKREFVSYKDYRDGVLTVCNGPADLAYGLIDPETWSGRGVLRSLPLAHPRLTLVRTGRQFTLIRKLVQEAGNTRNNANR